MKKIYRLKGLDCANCAAELERAIQKIDGVESATISFITERMNVELNEKNKEKVIKLVKKIIKKEEPDVELEEI